MKNNQQKPSGYHPYQRYQPPMKSSDDAVVDTEECKDCHATFDITQGERDFYKQMNFPEPVRCYSCRKARKVRGRK